VRPAAELERVAVTLDGNQPPERAREDGDDGMLQLSLGSLLAEPGWHFVELTIDRRGGRRERIVDPVLVGRFAVDDPEQAHACASRPISCTRW
jgi:hypothetical protein